MNKMKNVASGNTSSSFRHFLTNSTTHIRLSILHSFRINFHSSNAMSKKFRFSETDILAEDDIPGLLYYCWCRTQKCVRILQNENLQNRTPKGIEILYNKTLSPERKANTCK